MFHDNCVSRTAHAHSILFETCLQHVSYGKFGLLKLFSESFSPTKLCTYCLYRYLYMGLSTHKIAQ